MTKYEKKIDFPKRTIDVALEDLGVQDAPGVIFTFWENPSKPVVYAIFDIVMAATDELRKMTKEQMAAAEDAYYSAVSAIIVDCNVNGLKFDTKEDALAAFESPVLPVGIMHEIVTSYLAYMMKSSERIKKALALYLLGSATGRDGAEKVSTLMTQSSKQPKENSQDE